MEKLIACFSEIYYLIHVLYHSNDCYTFIYAVARIALVKPDKARGVEDVILRAAQTGQIVEKVACCYMDTINFFTLPHNSYRSLYMHFIPSDWNDLRLTSNEFLFCNIGIWGETYIPTWTNQYPDKQRNQSYSK